MGVRTYDATCIPYLLDASSGLLFGGNLSSLLSQPLILKLIQDDVACKTCDADNVMVPELAVKEKMTGELPIFPNAHRRHDEMKRIFRMKPARLGDAALLTSSCSQPLTIRRTEVISIISAPVGETKYPPKNGQIFLLLRHYDVHIS